MEFDMNVPSGSLRIIAVFVVGIATLGYGAYSYSAQSSALDSAVEVDTTISSTSVEENQLRRGVSYTPQATFTYRYDGEEYTSSNVYPGPEKQFGSEEGAEEVTSQYSPGQTTTVYVNEEDPSRAFLIEETQYFGPLIMVIGGVLFAGTGFVVLRRLFTE